MTARMKLLPYKMASKSSKDLASSLGILRLKKENSRYRYRDGDVVINWGGNTPLPYPTVNDPTACRVASDKVAAFGCLDSAEVSIPNYTGLRSQAEGWIEDGHKVVCRTLTRANSGRGIVMASTIEELVAAPLYVKYVKKQQEYRVHVAGGNVIDTQRKMRSRDVPDDQVDWQVRNLAGGFIFGREGVEADFLRDALAISSVTALGLDFGAVDIIYNERSGQYYVLEVNTAPGLQGTTLAKYTEYFNSLLGQ